LAGFAPLRLPVLVVSVLTVSLWLPQLRFAAGAPAPKTVTLNFKDAEIREVLGGLAEATGVNVVADGTVQGRMGLSVKGVTLEQAIQAIARLAQLQWAEQDGVYLLSRNPIPKPPMIEVRDGKLTVDVARMEIREFLQQVSAKSGLSLVPEQSLSGQVTVAVTGAPVEEGVRAILEAQGLEVRERGQGVRVVAKREPQRGARGAGEGQVGTAESAKDAEKGGNAETQRREGAEAGPAGGQAGVAPVPQLSPEVSANGRRSSASSTVSAVQTPLGHSDTVTLDRKDAQAADILAEIAKQTGVEIVVLTAPELTRTVRWTKVTVEEALRTLLLGTKYAYVKDGARYVVGDTTRKAGEDSAEAALFLTTEVIPLKHLRAEEAPALLGSVAGKESQSLIALPDLGALSVTGTADQIARVRSALAQIDVPAQQIMLQAVLLETSENLDKELGFQYLGEKSHLKGQGPLQGSLVYGTAGGFKEFLTTTLTALVSEGKARVLANPRVATLNGKKANIEITQDRYFRTSGIPATSIPSGDAGAGTDKDSTLFSPFVQSQIQTIKAGIMLDITPWVGAEGDITVEVTPTVSNLTGVSADGLPEVSQRTVTTTVRVKDGETIVIGGLKQEEETASVSKLPILGDLPLLGPLFRHTRKVSRQSELIILVTPRILATEGREGQGWSADDADDAEGEGQGRSTDYADDADARR
jgi:type IV pilus assembly protein PilQ